MGGGSGTGALPAPRQPQRWVLEGDTSGTPWTPAPAPAKGGLGDLTVFSMTLALEPKVPGSKDQQH